MCTVNLKGAQIDGVCLGFKAHLCTLSPAYNGFLIFTSGSTLVNLLMESLFDPLTFSIIGKTQTHATVCGTVCHR